VSEGGEEDSRKEGARSSLMALDLSRNGRWFLRAPARDFASLAAYQTRDGEGKGRGGRGLLIGSAGARIGQALKRIEEGE
jgi:hypothetical protein